MRGYGMLSLNVPGWIEKAPPTAGPLDAILKPVAVAPCSSDTHRLHSGADAHDLILGHEAIGEVVEVGSLVKRFKPGDRVVVPAGTPDWEQVAVQEPGACNSHDTGLLGSFKFLMQKDGVFAECFHVNNADANLVAMPEDVSLEDALMTVDMMSTGFHAVENANISFGDTVVVFGIGPVGLMSIAGAALRGAGRIYAIGTRPNCVELAKEYGATDIISYKEGDTVQQILERNKGQVSSAIIANTDVKCVAQALQLVKPNGVISSIAYFDRADVISFPAYLWGLGMSNVSLKSGFCPGGAYRIQHLLEVIRAGRCHPGKMLNYKYEGFEKIEDAFKVMDEKPRDLIKPYVIL